MLDKIKINKISSSESLIQSIKNDQFQLSKLEKCFFQCLFVFAIHIYSISNLIKTLFKEYLYIIFVHYCDETLKVTYYTSYIIIFSIFSNRFCCQLNHNWIVCFQILNSYLILSLLI